MKECLDYIKQTSMELELKNQEITNLMLKNEELKDKIAALDRQLQNKDNDYQNLIRVTNEWRDKYESISTKYDNVEALADGMAYALSRIAPRLYDEVKEDMEEAKKDRYVWSDIITAFERSRW